MIETTNTNGELKQFSTKEELIKFAQDLYLEDYDMPKPTDFQSAMYFLICLEDLIIDFKNPLPETSSEDKSPSDLSRINYYTSQLEKLNLAESDHRLGYQATMQIRGLAAHTKWLSLNDDSAKIIIQFLKDNFNV